MRLAMRSPALLIPMLALLNACGSAPQPPTVDESLKRPANTAMAVELQVCKSELHNTRIVANESNRLAEATAAKLERAAAWQQALASVQAVAQAAAAASGPSASGSPTSPQGNAVFSIGFAPSSARVAVPSDIEPALLDGARSAPLVVLRVQTSNTANSASASRISRERIAAVRSYLLSTGVDGARIRTTYQWPGERNADKSVVVGTGSSRAVEVEIYRAMPIARPVAIGTSSTSTP
jgi:hypothetical protein